MVRTESADCVTNAKAPQPQSRTKIHETWKSLLQESGQATSQVTTLTDLPMKQRKTLVKGHNLCVCTISCKQSTAVFSPEPQSQSGVWFRRGDVSLRGSVPWHSKKSRIEKWTTSSRDLPNMSLEDYAIDNYRVRVCQQLYYRIVCSYFTVYR